MKSHADPLQQVLPADNCGRESGEQVPSAPLPAERLLADLRKELMRRISEVRTASSVATMFGHDLKVNYANGAEAALVEVFEWLRERKTPAGAAGNEKAEPQHPARKP